MRSFYGHLQATGLMEGPTKVMRKPILRSSAIFPVIKSNEINTKITFLGYWLLKRHIKEVSLLVTLRNENGEIISRNFTIVSVAKSFIIDINEFDEIQDRKFIGSLELEINSVQDLMYPYPAFVVIYYGENFSTCVHSVGRIYNDIEDLQSNEEYKVKESGFDIYGSENLNPFIAFTNGPIPNENPIVKYELIDENGVIETNEFSINKLQPFETKFVFFNEYIDLINKLKNKKGTLKIGHNFEGFFPRFLSGNWNKENHFLSITHSFYDSSKTLDDKAYWVNSNPETYDSAVNIPLFSVNEYENDVVVYPIFSPSDFTISLIFYSQNGSKFYSLDDCFHSTTFANSIFNININSIIQDNNIDVPENSSVIIACNWLNKNKIPTRVKLGLNVRKKGAVVNLPSNICFAPILANPNFAAKPGTFKWSPIVNIFESILVITNSSFQKNYERNANLTCSFYRSQDEKFLERKITVNANENFWINLRDDIELKQFLNGEIGWLAVKSDNPFVAGWYFDICESGSVAADHFF